MGSNPTQSAMDYDSEIERAQNEVYRAQRRLATLKKEREAIRDRCPHLHREPHPSKIDPMNFDSNWGDGTWVAPCLDCGKWS